MAAGACCMRSCDRRAHAPPPRNRYLLELRAEAEFYGLSGLTAAIDRFPWSLTRAARAACVEEDAHW